MLNRIVLKLISLMPKALVLVFAKKYIAGPALKDAVRVTKEFAKKGGMTTIDVLGEFVSDKTRALHELEMSSKVITAIHEHAMPAYLSVKPTSLGLGIDPEFAYANILRLVKEAASYGVFVRLDMENSPYTSATLDIYKRIRDAGHDNIGFVIQAYMRRSMSDVKSLESYKPDVRLCKGIYVEPEEIAFKDKEEIRDNYKLLMDYMFTHGFRVRLATHDEELIEHGMAYIRSNGISGDRYEFQMLLGVRESKRDELLVKGHPVRIYVPFGDDWYGYSTRRLNENPAIVGHIIKSFFSKN